ncbi:MAG: polysaccharide biosynthesis/export family protein [bacterium]
MSKRIILFFMVGAMSVNSLLAQAKVATGTPDDSPVKVRLYKVGPGDVLQISAGPGAASEEAIVRVEQIGPDGRITFDLIGSYFVENKTVDEIDAELTKLLSDYIIDVDVTVSVATFNAKRVFVLGEVGRPGKYVINKQMTILDAIAEAGSPTLEASKTRVRLFKSTSTAEKSQEINVDLKKLMEKGALDQNLALEDGDVIFVPTDRLSSLGRLADKIFKPLRPVFVIGFIAGLWSLKNF